MNYIKKHKSAIICLGIVAILLIVSLFSTGQENVGTDTLINEPVVENISVEAPLTTEKPIVPTPTPVAPTATPETEEESIEVNSCTLTVRCDTILNNIENVAPEKIPLIPEDGVILPETEIEFSGTVTVFDILKNELKKHGIHLEFNQVSMYDSVYIEGIGNLYEFDAGNLSGWIYRVNGKVPSMGCSMYEIENGDKIEFLYTCNMGRDL